MKCEDCKWFEPREETEPDCEKEWDGFCRRYAPHPLVVDDIDAHDETYVYWPRVFTRENWCGEFKEKQK